MNLPDVGVGITFSLEIKPHVLDNLDLIDALLIEPQTFWFHTTNKSEPYKLNKDAVDVIKSIPRYKIIHGVASPVGGTIEPDEEQIPLLKRMIDEMKSPWASEHLSFNKARHAGNQFTTGFFLPPRQTIEGVNSSVGSIKTIATKLSVPFAVETGVNYLRPREDELPDGEFISRVVKSADCGLLLDLHNIWTNEVNGRQSVEDFLTQIPLDRVWEIHLAGGLEEDGYWLDAHSGEIPQPLLKLTQRIISRFPNLHAIIFELYPSYLSQISPSIIRKQLKVIQSLWLSRKASSVKASWHGDLQPLQDGTAIEGSYSPSNWEDVLGALVVGKTIDGKLSHELKQDPAIAIYRKLILSFRASMVVGALPLTSRLLFLKLGEDFNALLAEHWRKSSPELFASDEAQGFLRLLKGKDIAVDYLDDLIAYEESAMLARIDGENKTLTFDYDFMGLVNDLQNRKVPDVPKEGRFLLEISPESITYTRIHDREKTLVSHPYSQGRQWNH